MVEEETKVALGLCEAMGKKTLGTLDWNEG
jgi:hypothetical protein